MNRKILYLKSRIVSNLKTKYTIKELAELVGISNSYLQELFKKRSVKLLSNIYAIYDWKKLKSSWKHPSKVLNK
jgi:hypothetical protein